MQNKHWCSHDHSEPTDDLLLDITRYRLDIDQIQTRYRLDKDQIQTRYRLNTDQTKYRKYVLEKKSRKK